MVVMPSVDDVVNAWNAIEKAQEHYRRTLRACVEEGEAEGKSGRQAEISRRIGRTRETLRQDAMTDEERAQLRKAEADRRRARTVSPAKRAGKVAK